MKRTIVLAALLVAARAHAETDPAIAKLEKSLPPGWTVLATDTELVIRHDKPCYVTEPAATTSMGGGPVVTLELRYHLEPKWTDKQLAVARATNAKVREEVRALREQLVAAKRDPARSAQLARAEERANRRAITLPLCTLGESSLFVGEDTYRQLSLKLDPSEPMHEANQIVELVKRQCGA